MTESFSYAIMVAVTLTTGIALQVLWGLFANFLDKKRLEARLNEVSIAIGKNARSDENAPYTIEYLKNKLSPSKFENRITDAIGFGVTLIHWPLSIAITIFYVVMVLGRIFGFLYIETLALWIPMIMQITLNIAVMILAAFTRVIFGRYPGEAKAFNKEYAKTIKL